ncbi:hypothetical protein MYCTH_2295064 [Thermothelomyces thermophilus ATCC 42464]|uniref:Uncharacterized protein n=1 Tax=Thermothelomyces thermophilus (strain ATCC 42464 / BCRC 31852 / DSM 1799) TaxID=573729 RepID=G2Q3K1_THET4|nr:uncharacterized protein MYCTH_2295064 [Thermothelomyces thermophilus ATCC 42464]AEO53557.1 hypothetical protein MYCTH_2295064 [Thermothelomyces thermophilus ATCC 42464]
MSTKGKRESEGNGARRGTITCGWAARGRRRRAHADHLPSGPPMIDARFLWPWIAPN